MEAEEEDIQRRLDVKTRRVLQNMLNSAANSAEMVGQLGRAQDAAWWSWVVVGE